MDENDSIEEFIDKFDDLQDANKFMAAWAVFDQPSLCAKHPFKGRKTLHYNLHWGDQPVSAPIEGDRWMDLWRAADQCVRLSGDVHHIYIESFQVEDDQLTFYTGS